MRSFAFIIIALLAIAAPATASGLDALADGLHTWQVEGTSDVQGCCYGWRSGKVAKGGCRIDRNSVSVASNGDCAAGPGAAQVYVRMSEGAPVSVWVFSSACPVTAEGTIQDHGTVRASDSVDWFRSVIESRDVEQDVREKALFALVQTESDAAFRYLDRLLTER